MTDREMRNEIGLLTYKLDEAKKAAASLESRVKVVEDYTDVSEEECRRRILVEQVRQAQFDTRLKEKSLEGISDAVGFTVVGVLGVGAIFAFIGVFAVAAWIFS